jgi:NodT family efflux transporter outer membrane factor (OMF) lipoprotein
VQTRIALLKDSIGQEEEQLTIVAARARFGFVTELDVNQQRTQLAAANAQLPPLEAEQAAQIHALAVLLGREPEDLAAELGRAGPLPAVPTSLPVGLPAQLLRRRPDVREAERQLAAATAQIGVAVAKLFPSVDLLALPALATPIAGDLFTGRALGFIGLGMINWPVFEGSQLRASVRVKKEQREEAYLAYQKAVLVALQEAEDALARYSAEQRRLQSLRDSKTAAASSLHIAQEQYRAGLVTFINVLNAQTAVLTAQDQVAQSEQALAEDLVAVYKALGGGWGADTPVPGDMRGRETATPAPQTPVPQ